ncbi:MAG TPA: hypothetical protein P5036_01410 [Albidovulum sp.]|nr:hypothetical protein [Albidovulum sp.]
MNVQVCRFHDAQMGLIAGGAGGKGMKRDQGCSRNSARKKTSAGQWIRIVLRHVGSPMFQEMPNATIPM